MAKEDVGAKHASPARQITATAGDFAKLLEVNPTAKLQLENIIQARLLDEKDRELAEIKKRQVNGHEPRRATRKRAAKAIDGN